MQHKINAVTYRLFDRTLLISEATVLIGVRRARLLGEAQQTAAAETDPDRRILRYAFVNLISPVVDWGGRDPVTFEEFLDLPSDVADGWLDAVYSVNPGWRPRDDSEREIEAAEDEKKALT